MEYKLSHGIEVYAVSVPTLDVHACSYVLYGYSYEVMLSKFNPIAACSLRNRVVIAIHSCLAFLLFTCTSMMEIYSASRVVHMYTWSLQETERLWISS